MVMGKGMNPAMGGGMNEADLFGEGPATAPEVSDEDIDSMFGEGGEMGSADDKLFEGLSMAGYSPTPDQMEQIKAILEGGVAPEGLEPTEEGMEASAPSM